MQPNYGTEALEKFDDSNNYFQWLYKQIDIYINDRIIEVGAGRGHLTDCYFDFSEAICLTELDPNCYNFKVQVPIHWENRLYAS